MGDTYQSTSASDVSDGCYWPHVMGTCLRLTKRAIISCGAGVIVLLALVGLVVAGAVLLGKRGGRLDAMRADAAVNLKHMIAALSCRPV